jgi:beta-N-acetylhexosaminidase
VSIAPVIFGCAGTVLSNEEREFFASVNPYGFILFERNISNPGQVRRLTQELRETVVHPAVPILVDQEGGRVVRLRPPQWSKIPSARRLVSGVAEDQEVACHAIRLNSHLIACDLIATGISVSCMPVLDLVSSRGHKVIGDRAYSANPFEVARYGRAACQGLLECGVLPVIKHIPGHGRATLDSHLALPRINAKIEELVRTDFVPFRELREMPIAMTAHILFSAVDPVFPVTLSPTMVSRVIRDLIGFDGLLVTDDISMSALTGTLGYRARKALNAGCDLVLHCNGILSEMEEIAIAVHPMSAATHDRAAQCASLCTQKPSGIDFAADRRELNKLLT